MERKAEIVIIGGGAIGSSIAYQLTRMGKSDVVVLEKDELFSKASGANCGMVAPHYLYTDSHQLGIESMKILEELAHQTDTDFKLNKCGELHLIEMEKHTGIVQEKLALYHKDGLKADFLSAREARKLEPALQKELCGVVYLPWSYNLDPNLMNFAFYRGARLRGARFYQQTEVTDVICGGAKVRGVVTNRGKIFCDVVVNAAGIGAAKVARMVELELSLVYLRVEVFITQRTAPCLRHNIFDSRFHTFEHPDCAFDYPPCCNEHGVFLELMQTPSGNVLVGGSISLAGSEYRIFKDGLQYIFTSREPESLSFGVNTDYLPSLIDYAASFFPFIMDLNVLRCWGGYTSMAHNLMPIIADRSGPDGFITSTAYGGDGQTWAPIVGALVAQLVATGEAPELLKRYNALKF